MSENLIKLTREMGDMRADITGIRAELTALNRRLDDLLGSQLRDHAKRLADHGQRIGQLEHYRSWIAGAMAFAAAIGGAAATLLQMVLK